MYLVFTTNWGHKHESMKAWSMRKGREICYCGQQKADLDGTSFAYEYLVRLAYVMDFHPHAPNFHLRRPQCVVQM